MQENLAAEAYPRFPGVAAKRKVALFQPPPLIVSTVPVV
jgi:hypothetical protein